LVANIGLGQVQKEGFREPPILTSGADLSVLLPLLDETTTRYGAADVVERLCSGIVDPTAGEGAHWTGQTATR
jgi:hypothetical protein